MSLQLSLPASWARGYGLLSQRDPGELKRQVGRDRLDAKAQIHDIVHRLAERYHVPYAEVARAMGSVDDALADLLYDLESEIDEELHTP